LSCALFFSSAGNEGSTFDGTAADYEGDFADSGLSVGKFAGAAYDFDPGAGVQVVEPISPQSSAQIPVTLFWADPLGGAANDYDLYLLDAASNVISFSQDVQDPSTATGRSRSSTARRATRAASARSRSTSRASWNEG
jgi:hypothetical protein